MRCREHHRLCALNCAICGSDCKNADHRPGYDHIYGGQEYSDRRAAFRSAAREVVDYLMTYRYGMADENAIAWATTELGDYLFERLAAARDEAAREQALDRRADGMRV
jgi:hypothetical protein